MVSQVFYYNQAQQYPQIQQDYKDIKKHVEKTNPTDEGLKVALEALPPVRRLSSLPDKIQNGDYAPAVGLASLALINLPEDIVIISRGYENPFKYAYVINNAISEYSLGSEILNIYFDLLSYRGIENRFLQTTFKNYQLDMINVDNIEEQELPIDIQNGLNTFYKNNMNYILKNSALSEYEKSLIEVA